MIRGSDWGVTPLLPRPMSLLAAGAEPAMLIKVVGEGTRLMAAAKAGEQFAVLGPLAARGSCHRRITGPSSSPEASASRR